MTSRKIQNGSEDEDSSSDTDVTVASRNEGRRYESDHSFQVRAGSRSSSDSDDNRPLGSMRYSYRVYQILIIIIYVLSVSLCARFILGGWIIRMVIIVGIISLQQDCAKDKLYNPMNLE